MKISSVKVQHLDILFTDTFQHASASRSSGDSILVSVTTDEGTVGYGEGCPRDYVTGENCQQAAAFVHRVAGSVASGIHDFSDLSDWVRDNEKLIDENPSAWCALELAVLDAMATELDIPVGSLLGEPVVENRLFRYSAVIGAGSVSNLDKYLQAYSQLEFDDFKMKLCGDLDLDRQRIEYFAESTQQLRLRLDANNLWSDPFQAARYLDQLPDLFFAIEEPLVAKDFSALRQFLQLTDKPVILDESFTCRSDAECLFEHGNRCIANIRVSKMGGVIRSRHMVEVAEDGSLPYIVGAHVGESSLLTRAGMLVGRNDSGLLVAREGAAGEYLLSADICRHSISFSRGGVCRYSDAAPGLGCEINSKELSRYPEIITSHRLQ